MELPAQIDGENSGENWAKQDSIGLQTPPSLPFLPHRTLTSLHTFPVRSHTLETSASWEQTVKISSHLQQRPQKRMYSKGTNTVQINNMSQYKQVISFDSAAMPWWRMGKQTTPFLHTHISCLEIKQSTKSNDKIH